MFLFKNLRNWLSSLSKWIKKRIIDNIWYELIFYLQNNRKLMELYKLCLIRNESKLGITTSGLTLSFPLNSNLYHPKWTWNWNIYLVWDRYYICDSIFEWLSPIKQSLLTSSSFDGSIPFLTRYWLILSDSENVLKLNHKIKLK